MALVDDLKDETNKIFREEWKFRNGQVVPEPKDIGLGNDAVYFERATVLYADLSDSTGLVDGYKWWFAADIYKTFLHCAAKIIKNEGGTITAYDGDRIMGVFIGDWQTTSAVRCALKINYARLFIVNPALKSAFPKDTFVPNHTVGIDTGNLHAARTGVRGDNDIVWVGRPANYAAKLTEIDSDENTWITKDAYSWMRETVTIGGNPKRNMWKKYTWTEHDQSEIYGSNWWWEV